MDAMHQALAYVDFMDLSFPPNICLDVDAWGISDTKNYDSPDPKIAADARERMARHDRISRYVSVLKLFPRASRQQGPGYTRPGQYLAIALTEEKLSWQNTEAKLKKLRLCK